MPPRRPSVVSCLTALPRETRSSMLTVSCGALGPAFPGAIDLESRRRPNASGQVTTGESLHDAASFDAPLRAALLNAVLYDTTASVDSQGTRIYPLNSQRASVQFPRAMGEPLLEHLSSTFSLGTAQHVLIASQGKLIRTFSLRLRPMMLDGKV